MSAKQQALAEAVQAFKDDKEARDEATATRLRLIEKVKAAHAASNSDQEIANAFGQYSRARIQQFRRGIRRTKEST